jgi:putative phosphoribosyl transferase
MQLFRNRKEAGQLLAEKLKDYAKKPNLIVLALPRGGVPVAFEVAKALNAPLDIFLVRKLGVPGHEEFAMGAIATGGVRMLNENVIHGLHITREIIDQVTIKEQKELMRREEVYKGLRPEPELVDRDVILIDDGLATGASMQTAFNAIKKQRPASIIIGVPVAAPDVCSSFKKMADDIVCVYTPDSFMSVGRWYHDFSQTSDTEVIDLLKQAEKARLSVWVD